MLPFPSESQEICFQALLLRRRNAGRRSVAGESDYLLKTERAAIQQLYPFTSHYQIISGIKLHYLDEGRGDAVLFLHGNPTWSFLYRDYVRALSDRHRVVAVDHIGCGLSGKPGANAYSFTLEQRIADLESLIESLSLGDNLTLVVHDWGGPIGFGYAVCHPERIKNIVVFNSAAFPWPVGKKFPWLLRLCRKSRLVGYLIQRLNAFALPASYLMCAKRKLSPDIRKGYLAPYDTAANRIAIRRFIQDIPLEPDHISYRTIMSIKEGLPLLRQVPMIIFWGERDFIFDREICAEWSRYFPQARVHRFPEAGHNIAEDEAESILPLLRDFLELENRT
jgi:cis-3-alkyl-4-acyloxetan-2-one decarboxylase